MNKKGFTLVELLAVIVILAVIILIAINAVLPQMEKARKNSFADEVLSYAKAAETKYVTESTIEEGEDDINGYGICYDLSESGAGLTGEYIAKKDSKYEGIIILKKKNSDSNLYEKYAFITSGKYYYNSAVDKAATGDTAAQTAAAQIGADTTGALSVGKLTYKDAKSGGKSKLTYKTCCEYEKAHNPSSTCTD